MKTINIIITALVAVALSVIAMPAFAGQAEVVEVLQVSAIRQPAPQYQQYNSYGGGAAIGSALGGSIGYIAGRHSNAGMYIGPILGAVVGGVIGNDVQQRADQRSQLRGQLGFTAIVRTPYGLQSVRVAEDAMNVQPGQCAYLVQSYQGDELVPAQTRSCFSMRRSAAYNGGLPAAQSRAASAWASAWGQ